MRLSSFSDVCIAATKAAALSDAEADLSQILFAFNGPFAQSGPIAAWVVDTREAPSSTNFERECILTTTRKLRNA
jgi:hypothetical protein